MPIKRGPNGTFRSYSSANGRYIKSSTNFLTNLNNNKKHKYKPTEAQKRIDLLNRARKSNDLYLYDLFQKIENLFPGCVKMVNENIYDANLPKPHFREIDIITKNSFIEIKSGNSKCKFKQIIEQKRLADYYGKNYYVYAPNFKSGHLKVLRNNGIKVFNNHKELLKERI